MDEDYSKRSIFRQIFNQQHGFDNQKKLKKSAKSEKLLLKKKQNYQVWLTLINFSSADSLALTQRLKLEKELDVHKGCVNSIVWNGAGDKILSGSDDQKLVISNPFTSKVHVKYTTVHRSNIFSAKFLPQGDNRVISCSGNGSVIYTDLESVPLTVSETDTLVGGSYRASNEEANYFNCHTGTAYEVVPIPSESNSFFSCGEDGTVRFYDLRIVSKCNRQYCRENILVYAPTSVTALSLSPISHNYLAVGCSDFIRIFDRRFMKLVFPASDPSSASPPTSLNSLGAEYYTKAVKLFKIPLEEKRTYRVTSLVYSPNEQELLTSFSSEYLYLFDMSHEGVEFDGAPPVKGRRRRRESPKVLRKLRLRGDWSDTGSLIDFNCFVSDFTNGFSWRSRSSSTEWSFRAIKASTQLRTNESNDWITFTHAERPSSQKQSKWWK